MRISVAATVAVLFLTACGGGSDDERTIDGVFTLTAEAGTSRIGGWDDCSGRGGYDDFGPGMDITVRDGEGAIIGTGRTESLTEADMGEAGAAMLEQANTGETVPDEAIAELTELQIATVLAATISQSVKSCTVKFSVPVKETEFYSMEIGSRGDQTYSFDELEENAWFISLTLGG